MKEVALSILTKQLSVAWSIVILRDRKQEETPEVKVDKVRGAVLKHHQMTLWVTSLWNNGPLKKSIF